jgi:hypothetical protein
MFPILVSMFTVGIIVIHEYWYSRLARDETHFKPGNVCILPNFFAFVILNFRSVNSGEDVMP